MSEIVNLRQARKQKSREEERARADQNAALHGRSKADRVLAASRSAAARRMLDQHKLEEE